MDDLNGRVAVVTGGGSGIGRGIALALGAEGMTVAVGDLRPASARAVAEEIEDAGGCAFGVGMDVTDVESLAAGAAEVVGRAGGVNLLCANAGVFRSGRLKARGALASRPLSVRESAFQRTLARKGTDPRWHESPWRKGSSPGPPTNPD